MGDGTKENPFTSADIYMRIAENGNITEGLDLSGKYFEDGIDLTEIDLTGAILNGARLVKAVLKKAGLDKCHLKEALLTSAHLEGAFLKDARLEGVNLMCANLQSVDLGNANLKGAILRGTHLERAKLGNANLEGADLRGAHLEGAILIDANLEGVELGSAHLERADLRRARLDGAYWENVEFTSDTKLDDVDWGNYVLGQESFGDILILSTYRRLKSWYTEHGMYDIAAKFYYREREASRKGARRWNDRAAGWLSWAFFGYGEEWKRILIWIAVVIFGLAAAYHFWGSFDTSSYQDTLYYSAASFTALGYGQWAPQPTGWAKGMGAAEAIIGVFMMALLLVTFVRKWTR